MKTIANQLNIKKFPFEINDHNGNRIYYEDSEGFWIKKEFDCNNNELRYESSNGYWFIKEYDSKYNEIYYEESRGYWSRKEYDTNNNEIYYENSDGETIDTRPKIVELTMNEIALKLGIDVNLLKIKK